MAAGIDGAKMGTLTKETLKITIRNATQGEGWVDDVQTAMITFLSAEAQLAKAVVSSESDELKKVRTEVAAKRAERAARAQSGEEGESRVLVTLYTNFSRPVGGRVRVHV